MASYTPLWSHRLAFIALICCIHKAAAAGPIKYCSNLNTGSDFTPVYYQWQSYGECYDTCTQNNNFAFSILQGNNCWCSDYIPSATTSADDCKETCPGYPDDICGGDGLFVYYQLNKAAAGTKGASSSSSRTSISQITVTKDPDPPQTETVFVTPQPDPLQESSSSTSFSSTKTPPTQTPAPTSEPLRPTSSSWTPTPSISVETLGESVRTVTVTPTAPPAVASTNVPEASKGKSGGGLGTGGAVGLAIGLIVVFALIGGALFWLYKRKKNQNKEEEARRNLHDSQRSSTSGLQGDMTRSMSQHSRFVLGSNGQTVVGGFEPVTPTVEGSGSSRISAHGLKPVDPRLDPFGVAYGNRSRESLNTINDGHDYTRKILRTTNPDPDNDD